MGFEAWRRVPEAGACPWCLMLATRGAVYKSKATAATARGAGKYHRRCRCTAELEARYDRRTDIRTTPEDAARTVTIRNNGRAAAYSLARYRNLGLTDPPMLAWVTPRLTQVARAQDAASGKRRRSVDPRSFTPQPAAQRIGASTRPSAADLFAEKVVGEGDEHFDEAEILIARWLRAQHSFVVKSVQARDTAFPQIRGLSTPDAVGQGGALGRDWVTLEFKTVRGPASMESEIRKGLRKQSSRIVVDVIVEFMTRAEASKVLDTILRQYRHQPGRIDLIMVRGRSISGHTAWEL